MEVEYQKEGEEGSSTRIVEPYSLERELPNWRVHTWDRTRDGERSFRLDRMRDAKLLDETFERREGFEPSRLRDARMARVLYTKEVARWAIERGARRLADGTAVAELPVGSPEWLESEVFSYRGNAIVLEPDDLRRHIRDRAKSSRPNYASTGCGFRARPESRSSRPRRGLAAPSRASIEAVLL